jgi:hypothetical protein
MKTYFYFLIFLAAISLASCESEPAAENKVFKVDFEQSMSVGKQGDTYFVPVISTDNYVPMSENSDWCTIGEKTDEGFPFTVLSNSLATARTFDVVVAAVGFDFYRINITQEAGDPHFAIAAGERNKTFAQAGGELQVNVNGNVEYTVESSQEWCTVSDITVEGFKITAPPNGVQQRTATLSVRPTGFPDITVNVKQAGGEVLQNGWFINTLTPWTISSTDAFKRATDAYLPTGSPSGAHYIANNANATAGFEGRLTQHLVDIPNGIYTLSCDVAGYPGNSPSTDGIYLIAIDKSGFETQKKLPFPSGSWMSMKYPERKGECELSVNVTEGECTVGLYVKAVGGTASTMNFKVLNFKFE